MSSTQSKLEILIIEDNRDSAESMRLLLELDGHQATVAPHGRAALAAGTKNPPDVVLCDIELPGEMDGHDIAHAFRSDPELSSATLIAVSGHGETNAQQRALDAGFDAYLIKPVDIGELRRLLAASSRQAS